MGNRKRERELEFWPPKKPFGHEYLENSKLQRYMSIRNYLPSMEGNADSAYLKIIPIFIKYSVLAAV